MKKRVVKAIRRPLPSKSETPVIYRIARAACDGLKFQLNKVNSFYRSGYRIINLDQLQNHVAQLSLHACTCPQAISLAAKGISPIKLETELRTLGLASVLQAKCAGCNYLLNLETSKRIEKDNCISYDINVRAVWGCMATGNGAAHLTELLGTMDSPSMTRRTFSKIENDISQWWKEVLGKDCPQEFESQAFGNESANTHPESKSSAQECITAGPSHDTSSLPKSGYMRTGHQDRPMQRVKVSHRSSTAGKSWSLKGSARAVQIGNS
ncbi:hypothetical protein KP79_PYT25043 [Mizuhopecten yessoensis]|uniref:Mutator-like transposase domain-containing protein n=1 Tax=Mizuhopecten yessoensis TaxID=6573 RepID=A0A210PYT2_MIZYE|nr:hypothetical protein KP79_PYT25043 [Mizuhopecten yessoensis]